MVCGSSTDNLSAYLDTLICEAFLSIQATSQKLNVLKPFNMCSVPPVASWGGLWSIVHLAEGGHWNEGCSEDWQLLRKTTCRLLNMTCPKDLIECSALYTSEQHSKTGTSQRWTSSDWLVLSRFSQFRSD